MPFDKMGFTPENGFADMTAFPDPANETEVREQLMRLCVQIRDYLNDRLLPALEGAGGAAHVGVTPFPGVSAENVQAAIAELQQHINDINAGILPDFGVTTEKISNQAVTFAKLADEVVQKLNQVQPVALGGTGSTTVQGARDALDVYARGQMIDAETRAALGLAADAEPKTAMQTIGKVLRVAGSEVMPDGLYRTKTIDILQYFSETPLNVQSTAETDDYIYWSMPGNTTSGTPIYRMDKKTLAVEVRHVPATFIATTTETRTQWANIIAAQDNMVFFECAYADGSSSGYSNSSRGILSFVSDKCVGISDRYGGYDTINHRMNFLYYYKNAITLKSYKENMDAISSTSVSVNHAYYAHTAGQTVFAMWKDSSNNNCFLIFEPQSGSMTTLSTPATIKNTGEIRVARVTPEKVVLLYAEPTNTRMGTAVFHLDSRTWDIHPSAIATSVGGGYFGYLGVDSKGDIYYLFSGRVMIIGTDNAIKSISLFTMDNASQENRGREQGARLLFDTFALGVFFRSTANVKTGKTAYFYEGSSYYTGGVRHMSLCKNTEPWIFDTGVFSTRITGQGPAFLLRDVPNLGKQNIFNLVALGERIV